MAECRSFASVYPVHFITPAEAYKIPDAEVHFQHEVKPMVTGLSPEELGQSMPDWLIYFAEHFGQLRFIDAYTFHLEKHVLLSKCHNPKKLWILDNAGYRLKKTLRIQDDSKKLDSIPEEGT